MYTQTVPLIVDGQKVDAATTNAPLSALVQRTDWLKAQLESLAAGKQIVLPSEAVAPGMVAGTPVFYNDVTLRFEAAKTGVIVSEYNASDKSAFYQGIATNVSGTTADIVINGALTLTTTEWAAVTDTGIFSEGDYYLSDTATGKITENAGSFGVYVGHLRADGTMLLRASSGDTYLDHVHQQQLLLGKPAGTSPNPGIGNPQQITVVDTNQQGWLPASSFLSAPYNYTSGVQMPASAKFGYHIQHPSEAALRAIFPPVPPESTTLVQGGLVLEPNLKYIVNQYGIWWLTDSYGTAPWPVDYATTSSAPNVYLWSVRIPGATNLSDQITEAVIQELATSRLAEIGVTEVVSDDQDLLEVSGDSGNNTDGYKGRIVLRNAGVTRVKPERGLTVLATSGDSTNGFKGILTLNTNTELPAQFHFNSAGVHVPVSTNGFPSGTTISLVGAPLGAAGTDFIDYTFSTGPNELPNATDYYIVPTIQVAVNVAAPLVAGGTFTVELYRFVSGASLSSTNLIYTTQLTVPTGTAAGQLRSLTMPANSSAVVQRNRFGIIRIKNGTGGSPLATGVLRVLDVKYHLYKV